MRVYKSRDGTLNCISLNYPPLIASDRLEYSQEVFLVNLNISGTLGLQMSYSCFELSSLYRNSESGFNIELSKLEVGFLSHTMNDRETAVNPLVN